MLLGVILCSRDRLLERVRLLRRGNAEVDGEADVHLAYTVDHRAGFGLPRGLIQTTSALHIIANHKPLELVSGYHGLGISPDPYTTCGSGHNRCIAPSSEDRCHCVLEALRALYQDVIIASRPEALRAMYQGVTIASRPQLWQVQGLVR